MKERILIIGGSGFVGSNLARDLREKYTVICTYRNECTPVKGVQYISYKTLSDKDVSNDLIKKTDPEIVIYAAGSNDLLKCEQDGRETNYVHTAGATMALAASEPVKAKYIFLSSDVIFSGAHGNFSENDTAMPNNQLGKAKMSSENYIRSRSSNHIIIRSAPLLGRGPMDHPSWIDLIRENEIRGEKMPLTKKSLRNPVHISELSNLMMNVIENDLKNKTFHLGGLTKLSPYDLALKLFKQFELDQSLIEADEKDSRTEASDFSLNFSNTLRAFQSRPLSISESIEALK